MTTDEKTLVIVYQFGKVASTSLVRTLSQQPQLDVHQSHFLGESALRRIIPIAVGKATTPYFHEHLKGQLLSNVSLTYRMNQVLSGQGSAKLKVVSLVREPLEWFRSGVLQDIAGYRAELLAFADDCGLAEDDEAANLRAGLTEVLSRVSQLIDDLGGVRQTVLEFHQLGGQAMLADPPRDLAPIVRRLFFLALRPLTWFDEHFTACFGLGLDDFECDRGFWRAHRSRADFLILRYEDIENVLSPALATIGIEENGPLVRDNVSRSKPFADDVSAAFASDAGGALRDRFQSTDYAEFFDYLPKVSDTAAE